MRRAFSANSASMRPAHGAAVTVERIEPDPALGIGRETPPWPRPARDPSAAGWEAHERLGHGKLRTHFADRPGSSGTGRSGRNFKRAGVAGILVAQLRPPCPPPPRRPQDRGPGGARGGAPGPFRPRRQRVRRPSAAGHPAGQFQPPNCAQRGPSASRGTRSCGCSAGRSRRSVDVGRDAPQRPAGSAGRKCRHPSSMDPDQRLAAVGISTSMRRAPASRAFSTSFLDSGGRAFHPPSPAAIRLIAASSKLAEMSCLGAECCGLRRSCRKTLACAPPIRPPGTGPLSSAHCPLAKSHSHSLICM